MHVLRRSHYFYFFPLKNSKRIVTAPKSMKTQKPPERPEDWLNVPHGIARRHPSRCRTKKAVLSSINRLASASMPDKCRTHLSRHRPPLGHKSSYTASASVDHSLTIVAKVRHELGRNGVVGRLSGGLTLDYCPSLCHFVAHELGKVRHENREVRHEKKSCVRENVS